MRLGNRGNSRHHGPDEGTAESYGVTQAWQPVGDDAAGWVVTLQNYNWQGRPAMTTNPGGSTREVTYSACGCAGRDVVTIRDQAGLQVGDSMLDAYGRARSHDAMSALRDALTKILCGEGSPWFRDMRFIQLAPQGTKNYEI